MDKFTDEELYAMIEALNFVNREDLTGKLDLSLYATIQEKLYTELADRTTRQPEEHI